MSKLRVGVAGLGRGRLFVERFGELPDCEVVAVCDPKVEALAPHKRLAAHTDYDAFLGEGLDVVAVISPGPEHAAQSVKAMDSGAHVLCETPCVYSVDEAQAVVVATQRTKRRFMLAEDYVWMGWAVRARQRAEQGLFGQVVYAEGDYTHDCRDIMLMDEGGYVPFAERAKHHRAVKSWRATHLPPIIYTSHTLGPLLHIMDDRVTAVTAFSTGSRTAPELGTIDLEAGLFETAKGAIIRLTNGFTVAHPYALYYNLVGTRGSLKFLRANEDTLITYAEGEGDGWATAPAEWLARPDGKDHVAAMVAEFVRGIVRGTPPPLDVHRSLDFVLPGVVAHASATAGGKRMEVPDLRP